MRFLFAKFCCEGVGINSVGSFYVGIQRIRGKCTMMLLGVIFASLEEWEDWDSEMVVPGIFMTLGKFIWAIAFQARFPMAT